MTGNKIKSTNNNDNDNEQKKQQQKKAKAKSNGIKCKVEQRVGQKIKQEERGKEENEKLKKLKTQ